MHCFYHPLKDDITVYKAFSHRKYILGTVAGACNNEYIWHTCDGSVLDEVGATVDAIMRTFASRAEAELPNAYFKVATSYIFHQKHIS